VSHIRLTQPVSSTRLLDDAGSETLWFREIEMQEVSAARGVEMGKEIPGGQITAWLLWKAWLRQA
jgi:hypothetical protein